ncbi:MAG TPA: protein kinase [Pyrinomonadaceae bacterium]|nr:protein kinase [Pyrinomonadaceae bacterium]
MNCPNCNRPVREGTLFCTHCGTRTAHGRAPLEESVPTVERGGAEAIPPTIIATDPMIGRVLDGKYEIVSALGAGGMGAVYLARRVLIGDDVAVKVLHTKFAGDDTFVERFRREARAAAQLHHPNVVTIHDYGESRGAEGFAYIVMELVRGESLRDMLRREGKLETTRAVSLMRDICAGVGAAHRRGIVHRDIKPDNIIVMPADEDSATERVKVVDFGIAKLRDMAHDATLTEAGAMVGTPFYMSPEQCKGEHLEASADVYSLGALLYEMLAGTPPFVAQSLTGIILKHINEPPPPMPQDIRVPPALQAAVTRALSKDQSARQTDATEFARDIQAAAAQAPNTSAIPPTQPTAAIFDASTRPSPPAQPTQQNYGDALRQSQGGAQRQVYVERQDAAARQPQTYNAPPQPQSFAAPQPRRSRAPLFIALAVVLIFVVGGLAAVGLVLLSRSTGRREPRGEINRALPANDARRSDNRFEQGTGYNANAGATANTGTSANADARRTAPPANENSDADDDDISNLLNEEIPAESDSMQHAEQKILKGERLERGDLNGLSDAQLRALRNTIYARHGRTFRSPVLQAYFLTRSWYRPRTDYNDRMLTATDRANAELVKAYEESGG